MQPARTGPMFGPIFQVVLLGGVAATVGLSAAGWLAGLVFALLCWVAVTRALRRAGRAGLGPADRVTLVRATLVGGVMALIVDAMSRDVPVAVLVAFASAALVLDAVDGPVARRTATVSAFGARFDMEVDAFLILVLSVHVAGRFGWWVFAIGAMRYVYVVVGWMWPWLRGDLPPRRWRKVVAAVQGIVLTAAVARVLPQPVTVVALGCALALLVESFGRDVVWLWRHRPAESAERLVAWRAR